MSHIQNVRSDITVLGITEDESSIQIEWGCKQLEISGAPFGELENLKPITRKKSTADRQILLLHETVWPGERPPWANGGGYTDKEILERFGTYYDLIVTGDNHSGFVSELDGCLLVNPGCMMRSTADKIHYRPRVYLYYADTNTVVPSYYPIEKNVHDITYLDIVKEREERLTAYISNMDKRWKVGISFKKNLEAYFKQNKTPRLIKELIWQYLEM
jgi:predicted phosphodiesterase